MSAGKESVFTLLLFFFLMEGCSFFVGNAGKRELYKGMAFFDEGNCKEAEALLHQAVEKDPELWEGYLYLARCALGRDDFQQAFDLGKRALSLIYKDKKGRETIGAFFFEGGKQAYQKNDLDTTILFLENSAAIVRYNSDYHLWLGKVSLERGKKGDMKAAVWEFKAAEKNADDREITVSTIREILFQRAAKYSRQGNYYMESRCYLAYTENFDQEDVDAYIKISRAFQKMGDIVGGMYYANKAYQLDPENREVIKLLDSLNPI